jgi:hypothetical protein
MHLVRELDGWARVPPDKLVAVLHGVAKTHFGRPALTPDERRSREHWLGITTFELPCAVLARRDLSAVRLVFRMAHGMGLERIWRRLSRYQLLTLATLGPVQIEVVTPDPQSSTRIARTLRNRCKRRGRRLPVEICVLPSFLERGRPPIGQVLRTDQYAARGLPDPLSLRPLSRRAIR